jgi:hypothetical protein
METFVNIGVLESEIEARLLESILKERGIVHAIFSYHDTAYNGIFQVQKGWGKVLAPESAREEISTILSDIRAGGAVESTS